MDIYMYWEKHIGYVVSTGSDQTLQQAPKIPGSAKIMKNHCRVFNITVLTFATLQFNKFFIVKTEKYPETEIDYLSRPCTIAIQQFVHT